MKFIQKTHLSLALAMAIGGAASTQAVAAPQDPAVANGGLASTLTPYVAHNGLGQALIMPYYTTRDNQRTAINIMNTSGDSLAVKVVVREGKYSRDVLNFYILMSPYDSWTGYMSNSTGAPTLHRSNDEDTCVVGAFGRTVSNTYTPMATMIEPLSTAGLVDKTDTDTLHEGYITIIAAGKVDTAYVKQTTVLGVSTNVNAGADLAAAIKHGANGKPANCATAVAPFVTATGTDTNLVKGARGNAELDNYFLGLSPGENPLKGNLAILDADDGVAGGTQATAIANFNQTDSTATSGLLTATSGASRQTVETHEDLVTAQVFPYFNEPTLASNQGICAGTDVGLTEIENALRANSLINEWSYNPGTFAETDWVITLPTKGFRTDPSTTDANALGFCRGTVSANVGTSSTIYDGNGSGRANGLPIYYTLGAVDREEKMPTTAPIPSPSTSTRLSLTNEVNVISFKPSGTKGPLASNLATHFDLASQINGTPNGWAELKFDVGTSGVPVNQRLAGTPTTYDVAAIGFMYKVRKQPGSATTNFGQIIDHSATQSAIISDTANSTAAAALAAATVVKGLTVLTDLAAVTRALDAANVAAAAAAAEAKSLASSNPIAALQAANAAKTAADAVIAYAAANPTNAAAQTAKTAAQATLLIANDAITAANKALAVTSPTVSP